MTFPRTRKLAASAVLASLALANVALACDPSDPRCPLLNQLVDALQYKSSLEKVRSGCQAKAMEFQPDKVQAVAPGLFMGIAPGTSQWDEVRKAFEMYVVDSCGGDELPYLLLEGYRISWNKHLPGNELAAAVPVAKAQGREGLKAKADEVSAEVNAVFGQLLENMTRLAMSSFQTRLKGAVAGEALAICEREDEVKRSAGETVVPPLQTTVRNIPWQEALRKTSGAKR